MTTILKDGTSKTFVHQCIMCKTDYTYKLEDTQLKPEDKKEELNLNSKEQKDLELVFELLGMKNTLEDNLETPKLYVKCPVCKNLGRVYLMAYNEKFYNDGDMPNTGFLTGLGG